MNYKFNIGQEIKATWNRKGVIIAQIVVESGRLHYWEPAYEVKDGRGKFVVVEGDIIE